MVEGGSLYDTRRSGGGGGDYSSALTLPRSLDLWRSIGIVRSREYVKDVLEQGIHACQREWGMDEGLISPGCHSSPTGICEREDEEEEEDRPTLIRGANDTFASDSARDTGMTIGAPLTMLSSIALLKIPSPIGTPPSHLFIVTDLFIVTGLFIVTDPFSYR